MGEKIFSLRSFFPPSNPNLSLFYCPRIKPPDLVFASNEGLRPLDRRECFPAKRERRGLLRQRYWDLFAKPRLREMEAVLNEGISGKLPESDRDLLFALFPALPEISGRRPEDYVREVALPGGFEFREYILSFLPPDLQQTLGLMLEVEAKRGEGLGPLLSILPGENSSPWGEYRQKLAHQIGEILFGAYLYALADLSSSFLSPKNGEDLLNDFLADIAAAVPNQARIQVVISFDGAGEILLARLDSSFYQETRGLPNQLSLVLTGRRLGEGPDNFLIFPQRPSRRKSVLAAARKIFEERPFPLADLYGVRIVFGSAAYVHSFFKRLKGNLADRWEIYEEENKTPSPQSNLSFSKWFAERKGSDIKIEIQVYALRDPSGAIGSWLKKIFQPDHNDRAYRMKQLCAGVLPSFFPPEIYGFDWTDEGLRRRLLNYANERSQWSLLEMLTDPQEINPF